VISCKLNHCRFPYLLRLKPSPNMYACGLAAGYITLKTRSCLPVVEELVQSCQNLILTRRSYGKAVSKEEAAESGVKPKCYSYVKCCHSCVQYSCVKYRYFLCQILLFILLFLCQMSNPSVFPSVIPPECYSSGVFSRSRVNM
jgi:hypothetical protein